jgi:hypothetical protein
MYVKEKLRPVETTLGMGERDKGEWLDGVNSRMIYLV